MKSRKHDASRESQDSSRSDDNESFEDDIQFEEMFEVAYQDQNCSICGCLVAKRTAYDGLEAATIGFSTGARLFKNYRWDYPGHAGSTRECIYCFRRPEPIWWILHREKELGRQLRFSEINEVRGEWNLEAARYKLGLALDEYDAKVIKERERNGGKLAYKELKKIQREFNLVERCPDGGLSVLEFDEE